MATPKRVRRKPRVVKDMEAKQRISPQAIDLDEGDVIIGLSRGLTINLGDFESARIDAFVQAKTTEEEIESKFEELGDIIEKVLEHEEDKLYVD